MTKANKIEENREKKIKNKDKKKHEVEFIEQKYPSVVLGLDISTTCIGASIVYDNGNDKPEIIKITHIVPKIDKKIKGIEALILKKGIFEDEFLKKYVNIGITECVIEAPLKFAIGNSNPQTVSQLLMFNALLSESIYNILNIVPYYISSLDARTYSFPNILSIRKYNKNGDEYPPKVIEKNIKDNNLIPFADYPFDIDKKLIMMDLVNEMYDNIEWLFDKKGELKKENYDACDSLVCSLAYINIKKYGVMEPIVDGYKCEVNNNFGIKSYSYTFNSKIWTNIYEKKIILTRLASQLPTS